MKPNKFLQNRSGIYGIRNLTNDKIYVGQTICMYRRCYQYVSSFKIGKINHINDYLLNAMNKAGFENFEFFPLEFCDVELLQERELAWMVGLGTLNKDKGYNLRSDTETGMKVSPSTSLKISSNLKQQWANGTRSQHSEKMIKKWNENPHRREVQAMMFSRMRTKYEYVVTGSDNTPRTVLYAELRTLKLHNVIATMHREKSNTVTHKGFTIQRMPRGEA